MGQDRFDDVTLVVNGNAWDAWQAVRIRRSIDSLASDFEFQAAYDKVANAEINVGDACEVRINGDLVITGKIDSVASQKTDKNHNRVFTGRSLTRNVVDCSVYLKTNQIDKSTPFQIAQRIAGPLGVEVINEAGDQTAIDIFRWADAAIAGPVIQDAGRQQGLTVRDNEFGQLVITRARDAVSRGSLEEGDGVKGGSAGNLEGWRVFRSQQNRYSNYYIKGRKTGNDGRAGNQIRGEAQDNEVSDFRPLIIQAEGDLSNATAKTRAVHEAQRRIAWDFPVSVTVTGWRAEIDGKPWRVDALTRVKIPTENLDAELLIRSLIFDKSEAGTRTRMELVSPKAYESAPTATDSGQPIKAKLNIRQHIAKLEGDLLTVGDIGSASVSTK